MAKRLPVRREKAEQRHGDSPDDKKTGGVWRAGRDMKDRAAEGIAHIDEGDAEKGDMTEQRFQYTVVEGSRTRTAAGEKEDEQQAVVVLCGIESRFQTVTATAVNVVKGGERLVFDERTGGKEER